MMSELVLGSAWMKPPVEGWAEPATGVVDWVEAAPPELLLWLLAEGVLGEALAELPLLDDEPPPDEPPAPGKEARSTCASFTASAFFR